MPSAHLRGGGDALVGLREPRGEHDADETGSDHHGLDRVHRAETPHSPHPVYSSYILSYPYL